MEGGGLPLVSGGIGRGRVFWLFGLVPSGLDVVGEVVKPPWEVPWKVVHLCINLELT